MNDADEHSDGDDVLTTSVMDWALGERLGGEVPPDLRAAVRERLDAAPVLTPVPARVRQWPLFLAALLGVAVLGAVWWWERDVAPRAAQDPVVPPAPAKPIEPGQPTELPKPVTVSSRAQIDALPAETENVIGVGIEREEIPGLLRLRRLHTLELRAVMPSPHTPGQPTLPLNTLDDEGFALLASMKSLRRLRLVNQTALTTRGLSHLAQLPDLTELTVQWSDAGDDAWAVLSALPHLESLTLQNCPNLGVATTRRIARIASLRRLDLGSCLLPTEVFVPLGTLKDLVELSLPMAGVGQLHWRGGLLEFQSSVTDELLAAFVGMRSLRRLDISYHSATQQGLAMLQKALPALVIVDNLPAEQRR